MKNFLLLYSGNNNDKTNNLNGNVNNKSEFANSFDDHAGLEDYNKIARVENVEKLYNFHLNDSISSNSNSMISKNYIPKDLLINNTSVSSQISINDNLNIPK